MTNEAGLPEVTPDAIVADWIASHCACPGSLVELERAALSGHFNDAFLTSAPWTAFRQHVLALWKANDNVIIRGVPVVGDGTSGLLAALALSRHFKPYRGDKIVKYFRMSPWTRDLSHTLEEGHFHTDINTTPDPPVVTVIQCKSPDPGAPEYGEVRVARLHHLLHALEQSGESGTLDFLRDTDVTMVNETSPDDWTGRIVANGHIRFHPETLRAAQRRYGNLPADFEGHLQVIKEAALRVSIPIQLGAGDTLLVSNTRALHYRGACSVVYHSFPREFTTREVYILHLLDEPV
jgi:hypothetical protein